jgi:hypothetical protein
MRLTTLTNDTNIGALAERLYANLTPETRRAAESALLAANPHLSRAGAFKAGVVVQVPVVAGVRVKEASAGHDPVNDALKELAEAVTDYRKQLDASIGATKQSLADQAALLKTRDVKAAIDKSPEAKPLATSLAASLTARTKAMTDLEKRMPTVFTALVKDLESLGDRGD